MRLIWTPKGVRGKLQANQPDKDFVRISIRGYQRGYEAEIETDTDAITVVESRGQEKKREVKPKDVGIKDRTR